MAKIVIIGGGSYHWSPTLLGDIIATPQLEGSEIVLLDINKEAAADLKKLGDLMAQKVEREFEIKATDETESALKQADFVILTISTGGLETMRVDLEIPEKYGIYQSVGDTTGPGGISRALRNIPVVVEIARKMEKFCPNAFLFNYTNPLTTLTRAITRETRIKTAGFCHELFSTQGMLLNEVFQVEHSTELEIKAGGINHFLWIVELKIRGQDGFPILQKYAENYRQPPLPPDATPATRSLKQHDFRVVKFELFKKFGYFPAGGDRHLAEFLPYFLNPEADYGKKYKVALTTIEDRIKWLESDKKRVWETIKGEREIEIKVSQEAVTPIMVAMLEKREEVHILNLPNRGQIANFPHGAVVETMGVIGPSRLEGLAIGNFPAVLHGLLLNHIIKQEITVEAALRGDKKLALEAMLLDPLVRDFYSVEKMLDEMLLANKKFLPRFFE